MKSMYFCQWRKHWKWTETFNLSRPSDWSRLSWIPRKEEVAGGMNATRKLVVCHPCFGKWFVYGANTVFARNSRFFLFVPRGFLWSARILISTNWSPSLLIKPCKLVWLEKSHFLRWQGPNWSWKLSSRFRYCLRPWCFLMFMSGSAGRLRGGVRGRWGCSAPAPKIQGALWGLYHFVSSFVRKKKCYFMHETYSAGLFEHVLLCTCVLLRRCISKMWHVEAWNTWTCGKPSFWNQWDIFWVVPLATIFWVYKILIWHMSLDVW